MQCDGAMGGAAVAHKHVVENGAGAWMGGHERDSLLREVWEALMPHRLPRPLQMPYLLLFCCPQQPLATTLYCSGTPVAFPLAMPSQNPSLR